MRPTVHAARRIAIDVAARVVRAVCTEIVDAQNCCRRLPRSLYLLGDHGALLRRDPPANEYRSLDSSCLSTRCADKTRSTAAWLVTLMVNSKRDAEIWCSAIPSLPSTCSIREHCSRKADRQAANIEGRIPHSANTCFKERPTKSLPLHPSARVDVGEAFNHLKSSTSLLSSNTGARCMKPTLASSLSTASCHLARCNGFMGQVLRFNRRATRRT